MSENDYTYDSIKKILKNIPENFKILEEIVDIDIQKEFFESMKNIHLTPKEEVTELIKKLNNTNSKYEHKNILQKLSSIDSVEAYRAIEQYQNSSEKDIKDWATLALQQSKLIIQSSLLDEQLIFISTGLGGKNGNLRYFLIFPFSDSRVTLTELQIKILRDEVEFYILKYKGEIEEINLTSRFASFIITLPLKAPIPELIKLILDECNQYGSYLSEDVLITNMKRFSEEEIIGIIDKKKSFAD